MHVVIVRKEPCDSQKVHTFTEDVLGCQQLIDGFHVPIAGEGNRLWA